MTDPGLTIVIPTYNRPAILPRALRSALDQSAPCRVVVSDDGDCDRTAAILRDAFGADLRSGRVAHLRTGATDAWGNWKAGAEAAETEFVAWLQDDDVVCRDYAARILHAFGGAAKLGRRPHVWMACLYCADATATMGLRYAGNGPLVPMEALHGVCEPGHWSGGKALAASMYLTSWSLSPALAYRNGPGFRAALAAMPPACDIHVERIIPAEMAQHDGFIADPAVVGYWAQHDGHLSHQQHPDQPRQTALLVRHLDGLLDRLDGWEAQFAAWCGVVQPALVLAWLGQLDQTEEEGGKSRHGDALRRVLLGSLDGRIRTVPAPARPRRPWWRRLMGRA